MRKLIAIVILSGLFLAQSPINASACDCSSFPDSNDVTSPAWSDWAARNTHILRGTVIGEEKECVPPEPNPVLTCRTYTIKLTKVWKGTLQSPAHVFSKGPRDDDMCGVVTANVGEEYIINATESEGKIHLSRCGLLSVPSGDNVSAYTRKSFEEEFELRIQQLDELF